MVRFPRNFRDTLLSTGTTRTLLVAAVVVAVLFVTLVAVYRGFH